MADDHETIWKDFGEAVNMTPSELEKFLDTDESKEVGWKGEDGDGAGESVGHKSGKRIVEIKRKKKADLNLFQANMEEMQTAQQAQMQATPRSTSSGISRTGPQRQRSGAALVGFPPPPPPRREGAG